MSKIIPHLFRCVSYPAKDPQRALFFFAGFGTKAWHYKPVYRQLNKLGYTVHAYEFPGRYLLDADRGVLDGIRKDMQKDASQKIATHKNQGISEFASFGVSLGSLYSAAVARANPDIKRMVHVTSYGNSALQIWEYPSLKKMKKMYTDQGLSVDDVKKINPELETTYEIEKLVGKDILLYLSRDDRIIYPHNTQQFIDAAHQASLNLETIIGKGGHWKFIGSTLLRGRRWRIFLN